MNNIMDLIKADLEDFTVDILEPIEIFGDFEKEDFIIEINTSLYDDNDFSIELFSEIY